MSEDAMKTDDLHELNAFMANNSTKSNTHMFLLIFKQGCPPCMALHPTWTNIQTQTPNMFALDQQNIKRTHSVIQNYPILGYPTMLHLHTINGLWNPDVYTGNRDSKSLNMWINSFASGGRNLKTIKRNRKRSQGRPQLRKYKTIRKKNKRLYKKSRMRPFNKRIRTRYTTK
jgi:thiol-disulfide isomerase/thioredoxin